MPEPITPHEQDHEILSRVIYPAEDGRDHHQAVGSMDAASGESERTVNTMKRIGIFLRKVILPLLLAALLLLLFKPVYMENGTINYLLLWICVGIPFGIHRMFLWLVPHKFDLAGTVGVFALNVIIGGLIGGFALIWQVASGIVATVKG